MCEREGLNRRFALQLASQLPPDPDDAARVVELLTKFVHEFLLRDRAPVPLREVGSLPIAVSSLASK